jgi:putative pyruvate formate lyase activating enzyme
MPRIEPVYLELYRSGELARRVGELVFDDNGLARRGLLVRHLVMPNRLAGTRQICRWICDELSPQTYVNIMAQYRPEGRADRYDAINRRISTDEYVEALRIADEAGLRRLDIRSKRAAGAGSGR